jgi:hypothetical protein
LSDNSTSPRSACIAVQLLQAGWLLPIAHQPVPMQMLMNAEPCELYTVLTFDALCRA